MRKFPMRYTQGRGASCYNGRHTSLEWFQAIPNGESRLIDPEGKPFAADARIQGDDMVVVSSREVKEAFGVYYAWAVNPAGANLINEAGLPASPFRAGKHGAEKTITE